MINWDALLNSNWTPPETFEDFFEIGQRYGRQMDYKSALANKMANDAWAQGFKQGADVGVKTEFDESTIEESPQVNIEEKGTTYKKAYVNSAIKNIKNDSQFIIIDKKTGNRKFYNKLIEIPFSIPQNLNDNYIVSNNDNIFVNLKNLPDDLNPKTQLKGDILGEKKVLNAKQWGLNEELITKIKQNRASRKIKPTQNIQQQKIKNLFQRRMNRNQIIEEVNKNPGQYGFKRSIKYDDLYNIIPKNEWPDGRKKFQRSPMKKSNQRR